MLPTYALDSYSYRVGGWCYESRVNFTFFYWTFEKLLKLNIFNFLVDTSRTLIAALFPPISRASFESLL